MDTEKRICSLSRCCRENVDSIDELTCTCKAPISFELQKSELRVREGYGHLSPLGNSEALKEFVLFSDPSCTAFKSFRSEAALSFQPTPKGFLWSGSLLTYREPAKKAGYLQRASSSLRLLLDSSAATISHGLGSFRCSQDARRELAILDPQTRLWSVKTAIPDPGTDFYQLGIRNHVIQPFGFYMLANRHTGRVKIFAGSFGNGNAIECGTRSKRWISRDHYDAFADRSSLLIWKPTKFNESGVPCDGKWIEISVLGNGHELRPNADEPGLPLDDSNWNTLVDYTVIYNNGVCFLWRGQCEKKKQVRVSTLFLEGLVCPVTLDRIPINHLNLPFEPRQAKTAISRVLPFLARPCETFRKDRPWFYSRCGFLSSNLVMSYHISKINCNLKSLQINAAYAEHPDH